MNPWLYAALCVVLPALWGLVVVALSNAIERRLRRMSKDGKSAAVPPIDYHI